MIRGPLALVGLLGVGCGAPVQATTPTGATATGAGGTTTGTGEGTTDGETGMTGADATGDPNPPTGTAADTGPTCRPEVCNVLDDDCNDACDEGPIEDCRIGVHRAFGPNTGHVYTTDLEATDDADLMLEFADYFFVYAQAQPDLLALYVCRKDDGRPLLTTDAGCEGLGMQTDTVGFVAADERCGATPLYRLQNPNNTAQFYTLDEGERAMAIAEQDFIDEGITGWVWYNE
jgi:hypothetical protein